jgi:hypothetical protein
MMIRNCSIYSFRIGPQGFGFTEGLTVVDSRITDIDDLGQTMEIADFTSMTGGILKIPGGFNSGSNPATGMVPGSRWFFSGQLDNYGLPFVVLDVTQDASFTYIKTTLPTTLPVFNMTPINNPTRLRRHPAHNATFRNVVGCNLALAMSSAPPNRPLFEYAKMSFVGVASNGTYLAKVWGTLVSLKVNVIRAYTGAQPTLLIVLRGGCVSPTYTSVDWTVTIDLKTVGQRTITPTSVTGSVGADVLGAAPGAVWITTGNFVDSVSSDPSADSDDKQPIWEMELTADQGITAMDATLYRGAPI